MKKAKANLWSKRIISLLLTAVITLLFAMPASAENVSQAKDTVFVK